MAVLCFAYAFPFVFCLCFSFCVLLFGYTQKSGMLERMGHGCTAYFSVRCRWSSFLIIGYSMDKHGPCL